MSKKYILAIDQGTTSTRAIIFDEKGSIIAQNSRSHEQLYPNPGWVSHNAKEIYFNTVEVCKKAMELANVEPLQIAGIGITNQRETVVAWDKETGEPVCDAIVWQCRRTADLCRSITNDGFGDTIRAKTGLLVDPYFSATKIKWMLDNVERAKALRSSGRLLVGTIDSYIIWHLTGKKCHVTDFTNASRTMLFNITDLRWDDELLRYFDIPAEILPHVVPSSGVIGYTDESVFGTAIPISGIAGDQHASLFGQTCFSVGDVKNTYGTGCFILKNIGDKPIITKNKLLTTIAWNIGGRTTYALEGSVFIAGAAISWLMKEMKLIDDVNELNEICKNTPDTGGVYFVPAFSGLGAPYWDMYARGCICGMTLGTNRSHIIRAVMEAIAFQSRDVINHMEAESGLHMTRLRVDGGVCKSDFGMQFQSDILNIAVERPANTETTALGAAYLAGLAVSYWSGTDDIVKQRQVDKVFEPVMAKVEADGRYRMWLKAVEKAMGWENTN